MPNDFTYPVQILQEHTRALEAALTVCLADPGHKPVHRLRTETRRVEAQIELLSHIPEMPEHRTEADRFLRTLKRLRRAAGVVRDFDVHRRKLEDLAEAAEQQAAAPGVLPAASAKKGSRKKKGPGGGEEATTKLLNEDLPKGGSSEVTDLGKGATELRKHIDDQRDAAAADFQKLLTKRQVKTASAAEALLKVLQGATEVKMPVSELLRQAEAVFTRDGLLEKGDVQSLGEDDLHSARKAAKAARYLAETLPGNPAAEQAAEHFESLQEAGGKWHDSLELARAARKYLGKNHELSVAMSSERDRNLELYREALIQEVQGKGSAEKKRKDRSSKKAGKRSLAGA